MEFLHQMLIPKDRVAVLIGKDGEVKKRIEGATGARMDINSVEGEVDISCDDGLGLYAAKEIVKAIGRGFNPGIALLLLKPDYIFDQLRIDTTKSSLTRLKGRVIGSEGKSRNTLEDLTKTYICVYGKTICIIGYAENVALARKAVELLVKGSTHATVYRFLEKKMKERRVGVE